MQPGGFHHEVNDSRIGVTARHYLAGNAVLYVSPQRAQDNFDFDRRTDQVA